jgi:hypothetical protein
MSELPGRPNLDQLRHQARDLLRAAAGGDPAALTRLRAVSEQVTLSAAQLAVARDYGLASWPALHAEVERRLADLALGADSTGPAGPRWSFGGAAAIATAAGLLQVGGLVAGPGHAALEVSIFPSGESWPPYGADAASGRQAGASMPALAEAIVGSVTLTDDQGMAYTLRAGTMSGRPPRRDQEGWLVTLSLEIAPFPARERGWLELRGQDGSVARLMPSPRPVTRVTRLAPVPVSPAVRELSELALRLIRLHLTAEREDVEQLCSEALARAAEIQQSGQPGAVADRSGQLTRLCAFLLGHGPADGLPREWSSMINAAHETDGAAQHLNIAAVLPSVADTVVWVDSLHSESETWKVYVHSSPGWDAWGASQAGRPELSIDAHDDLGGRYLSAFAGSSGRTRSGEPGDPGDPGYNDHAELCFRFHPRLNPRARALTLIFRRGAEPVAVELRLP